MLIKNNIKNNINKSALIASLCKEEDNVFREGERSFCLIVKLPNKKEGLTEARTRVTGFKVPCTNHYTIKPKYIAF